MIYWYRYIILYIINNIWYIFNKNICITYKHFPNMLLESYFEPSFLPLKMTWYHRRLKKELLDRIVSCKAVSILSPNYVQNSPAVQSTLFSYKNQWHVFNVDLVHFLLPNVKITFKDKSELSKPLIQFCCASFSPLTEQD